MFETLQAQPADKILALMQMYKDDPRETKIDLGVGVYKDATGLTPVMRAVKAAEHQLWEAQTSKAYTGLAGDPAFGDAMVQMVLIRPQMVLIRPPTMNAMLLYRSPIVCAGEKYRVWSGAG